jgi:hypothetical protein
MLLFCVLESDTILGVEEAWEKQCLVVFLPFPYNIKYALFFK